MYIAWPVMKEDVYSVYLRTYLVIIIDKKADMCKLYIEAAAATAARTG